MKGEERLAVRAVVSQIKKGFSREVVFATKPKVQVGVGQVTRESCSWERGQRGSVVCLKANSNWAVS